jgi:peptide/nickel transport system permease protein
MFNNYIVDPEKPVEALGRTGDTPTQLAGDDRPADEWPEKTAIWVELPRQLLFLILAVVLAALILVLLAVTVAAVQGQSGIVWSESMITRGSVAELVSRFLPNSLTLILSAHFLALLMAVLPVAIALLADRLENQSGPAGSAIKGLGRLWAFSQGTLPVPALCLFLVLIFAIRLDWLPAVSMATPGSDSLGDRLQHLILPSVTLALLPAVLTAQAAARQLTRPGPKGGRWHWLAGIATLLGTWLGLAGVVVSGLVVVEALFAWPGIGRLLHDSLLRQDLPVFFGTLAVMIGLLIPARLGAIFFRWLARLSLSRVLANDRPADLEAGGTRLPWLRKAARFWFVACLALLIIPLVIFIVGATVDPEAALSPDPANRLAAPSAEHPWGTDQLGRDLRSNAFRGAFNSLGTAFLASLVLLVFAGLAGSLTGFLAGRRKWPAESAADLLLLPADALLLLPAVPLAMAVVLLFEPGRIALLVALLVVLFPRVMRAAHSLWLNQPDGSRIVWRILIGDGAVLVAGIYAALATEISLSFLGIGLPEPTPTLGKVLSGSLRFLLQSEAGIMWVIVLILLCAASLYFAADALIGYFTTKETMARLNE